MPAFGEIIEHINSLSDDEKGKYITNEMNNNLSMISRQREHRNVLFYGSAFLQKATLPPFHTNIMHEDINGFMTSIHGMDCTKGLTLVLHTPGGIINAAETIVAYLQSKFEYIETIVPVYAMSAGTMISLGTNRVVMGRQSQLGPIDPQIFIGNGTVSARAIQEQFSRAHAEISGNPILAHVWAPILQSLGPALLTESTNALAYGERMVASWLKTRMFSGHSDVDFLSTETAKFFNDASTHLSHGRRIDRNEVRSKGIPVEDLEADQHLQEAVLTAYHLMTFMFEMSPATKIMFTSHGRSWIKNIGG